MRLITRYLSCCQRYKGQGVSPSKSFTQPTERARCEIHKREKQTIIREGELDVLVVLLHIINKYEEETTMKNDDGCISGACGADFLVALLASGGGR